MIEIRNVEAIKKGSLLAKCDVYIKPWHLILKEVKIFEKGAQRFLGMPARDIIRSDGSRAYCELIDFDSESVKKRFRSQILSAIDQYLEENPDLNPEPVIEDSEDVPF